MGRAARERALDEHTYLHRARRLLDLLGVGTSEAVSGVGSTEPPRSGGAGLAGAGAGANA
jgi:hypothetical protein